MNNIDLYPEFGYLIDSHLNTVNCISKSGYISIISNKLYTAKGNELWQESDLVNLLYIKFGITSIDELDLNNPTQLDFNEFMEEQNFDSEEEARKEWDTYYIPVVIIN